MIVACSLWNGRNKRVLYHAVSDFHTDHDIEINVYVSLINGTTLLLMLMLGVINFSADFCLWQIPQFCCLVHCFIYHHDEIVHPIYTVTSPCRSVKLPQLKLYDAEIAIQQCQCLVDLHIKSEKDFHSYLSEKPEGLTNLHFTWNMAMKNPQHGYQSSHKQLHLWMGNRWLLVVNRWLMDG